MNATTTSTTSSVNNSNQNNNQHPREKKDDNNDDCNLLSIVSIPDLWWNHFVPFLTVQDICRCEQVFLHNTNNNNNDKTWQLLCQRDLKITTESKAAPNETFQTICYYETWKQVYLHWYAWHQYTHSATTTAQGFQAIQLYQTIQSYCTSIPGQYTNIQPSLAPPLNTTTLKTWVQHPIVPSDLIAFYAVCGGQYALTGRSADEDFWAALLGCYTCYHAFYAMRLVDANQMGPAGVSTRAHYPNNHVIVALSIGYPKYCLSVRKDTLANDPHGRLVRLHPLGHDEHSIVVGDQGILHYLQTYMEQLMLGIYRPTYIVPESPHVQGISLFPNAGDAVSICVTQGIEVRASARWFPTMENSNEHEEQEQGLNFGYSIRIRMIDSSIGNTCQLVSRHWEFVNGHGKVRRVDGEAVVGKQPLFFFHSVDETDNNDHDDDDNDENKTGSFGYYDLGPSGDGQMYKNIAFLYQSQSGPVAGTTREGTHGAHVKGSFRFVPGSLEQPKGPMFHVTVAPFPLNVPFPFY